MGKIPPNAKRVFKGQIFEIWQWPQKMFNGTTETFEMVKRPTTIQIIATMNGRILTVREEQPDRPPREFGLYGGRGEDGETPLETAKRELLEESGLASESWELWKVYEPAIKMDWQVYFFIARDCRKIAEPQLEAGEKIEQKEMDFETFSETIMKNGYWSPQFATDILQLKLSGQLNELKNKIFPSS